MNEAKNYVIRILNDQYTIHSDESQDHIDKSSELVNLFVREILNDNKHIEHKKAAVLAALRMASHILDLKAQLEAVTCSERSMIDSLTMLHEQLSEFDHM